MVWVMSKVMVCCRGLQLFVEGLVGGQEAGDAELDPARDVGLGSVDEPLGLHVGDTDRGNPGTSVELRRQRIPGGTQVRLRVSVTGRHVDDRGLDFRPREAGDGRVQGATRSRSHRVLVVRAEVARIVHRIRPREGHVGRDRDRVLPERCQ